VETSWECPAWGATKGCLELAANLAFIDLGIQRLASVQLPVTAVETEQTQL